MTRARESLLATLAAIPDSARYLLPRPGDTELPATVIEDPAWLAQQVRLRGEIWGIDDRRTLATLWWYSAGCPGRPRAGTARAAQRSGRGWRVRFPSAYATSANACSGAFRALSLGGQGRAFPARLPVPTASSGHRKR